MYKMTCSHVRVRHVTGGGLQTTKQKKKKFNKLQVQAMSKQDEQTKMAEAWGEKFKDLADIISFKKIRRYLNT
jgi:hypothetical protein